MTRLLEWLPRGNTLDDAAWHRRHRLLQVVLAIHIPVLLALGLGLGNPVVLLLGAGIAPPGRPVGPRYRPALIP